MNKPTGAMLQVYVINWLIGRCESQFVRAWLIQERKLVQANGPINANGERIDGYETSD